MQPDAHAALVEQLEEDGKLWRQNPQRLREVLADGSARAKVPHVTPHVLRHTFGTRWLQAGGDIYKLSKDPRTFQCRCHRAALRAFVEGGPGVRKPAGEDPGRAERYGECGADAAAAERNEPLTMFR